MLFKKPDFRRNPFKASWKRLLWRLRWYLSSVPIELHTPNGLRILAPKGGAGAAIYYQGVSEPDVMSFIQGNLKHGNIFIDIGAHIGEYTLTASKIVGNNGQVHAFEPSPHIFEILKKNVNLNNLSNIFLNQKAVSDQNGDIQFEIHREPSISSVKKLHQSKNVPLQTISIESMRLDTYWKSVIKGIKVDLIKIDVEGAELLVLSGATELLSLNADNAPIIIFEYSPKNYASFGIEPVQVLKLLKDLKYKIFTYSINEGLKPLRNIPSCDLNLVATKAIIE
jgi:FkbM family methyltransferase